MNTLNPIIEPRVLERKKPPKKRCELKKCKKTLRLIDLVTKCACNKFFCTRHMLPEKHDCEALEKMKKDKMEQLAKQLGKPSSKKEMFNLDI